MLQDAGHNIIDPRGRLLPRSYDVLGNQSVHCIDHLLKTGHIPTFFTHIPSLWCFSYAGLFTTFIFQKPDPDIAPPLTTPFLPVGSHNPDEVSYL